MSLNLEQTKNWYFNTQSDFWYKHQMPVTRRALISLLSGSFSDADPGEAAWGLLRDAIPRIESRQVIFIGSSHLVIDLPERAPGIKKLTHVWSIHALCT